jgi:hypothetical protein
MTSPRVLRALGAALVSAACSETTDPPSGALFDAGADHASASAPAPGEWRCKDSPRDLRCDCERDPATPRADFTLAKCPYYKCCFTYAPGPGTPEKTAAPDQRECACRAVAQEIECNQMMKTLETEAAGALVDYARSPTCP